MNRQTFETPKNCISHVDPFLNQTTDINIQASVVIFIFITFKTCLYSMHNIRITRRHLNAENSYTKYVCDFSVFIQLN